MHLKKIKISLILLPLIWWGIFLSPTPTIKTFTTVNPILDVSGFPPLYRSEIEQALTGNFETIHKLLKEWGYEATTIPFESAPETGPGPDLKAFAITSVFPQTYAAASIVSSLTTPLALPWGFKSYIPIYKNNSPEIKDYDLYTLHPKLALISSYTNPHTLARLKAYNIPYAAISTPESLDELIDEVTQVGHWLNCDATLFAFFIHALHAELKMRTPKDAPQLLQYTGQLEPIDFNPIWQPCRANSSKDLIVATSPDPRIQHLLLSHPLLQQADHIYFLNIRFTHFPTHLSLLAYFDYINICTNVF